MDNKDLEELKNQVINYLTVLSLEVNKDNIRNFIYENYYGRKEILDQGVEYIIEHI